MTGPLYPGVNDLRLWRRLVKHARAMAANPGGAAGDLKAAAKAARRAVAPSHEAQARLTSPLIRLADDFAAMGGVARANRAGELSWLAEGLAPLVGAEARSGSPGHRPRLDRPAGAGRPTLTQGLTNRLGLRILPEEHDDPRPVRAPRADIDG